MRIATLLCAAHFFKVGCAAPQLIEGLYSPWRLDRIFHHTTASLSCAEGEFDIFISRSKEHVDKMLAAHENASGFKSLRTIYSTSKGKVSFTVSPLNETWFSAKPVGSSLSGRSVEVNCTVQVSSAFSQNSFISSVAGILLFKTAPIFARERYFRLSSGGVLMAAAAVVILALFVCSLLGNSPKVKVGLLGLGLWGQNVLFETLKSLADVEGLLNNPWLLGYLITSFMVGLFFTAYFDSTLSNQHESSLAGAVDLSLRFIGSAFIYKGVKDERYAAAVIFVLLTTELISTLHRRLGAFWPSTQTAVPRPVADALDEPLISPVNRERPQFSGSLNTTRSSLTPNDQYPSLGQMAHETLITPERPLLSGSHISVGNSSTPNCTSPGQVVQVLSPIVLKGQILNEVTQKVIKIDGDTYNRLLARGHVPDFARGIISPPNQKEPETTVLSTTRKYSGDDPSSSKKQRN